MSNRRFTDDDLVAMVTMYREGSSSLVIARQLGCDPQTVLSWLRRLDVPVRPPADRSVQANRVKRLLERE